MTKRRNNITVQQGRMLFALARRRGMGLLELRAMTPAGSVSRLSCVEADAIIDRLAAGIVKRRPRPRRGRRASAGQLSLIGELIRSTGVGAGWLRRFGVDDVAGIRDQATARKIIGALSALQRARDPRQQGIASARPKAAREPSGVKSHTPAPSDAVGDTGT